MASTGFKGVDIRQTNGSGVVYRSFFQDSAGNIVPSGAATLFLYELQQDGSLKSYDWYDHTFKTGALTVETASMAQQKGNNSTRDTGLYTYALPTGSGHTLSGIYLARTNNPSASPPDQYREYQYGDAQGDGLNAFSDNTMLRVFSAVDETPVGSGAHNLLNAARFLRNKWATVSGTLTVYREDGATTAWTSTLSTDTAAQPITSSVPS